MLSTSQTRSTTDSVIRVTIDGKYVIVKTIYRGKQYNLYLAIKKEMQDDFNPDEDQNFFLIKMKKQTQQNEIIPELAFLTKLKDANCVPQIVDYGEQVIRGAKYHYQVMQRHGPSIKLIYNYLSRNIPIPILCLIAIQTLTCLEIVHKHSIVHRNIRPKKLLLSLDGNDIQLCDFKFACKYKKQHGQFIVSETYRFASNKHFLNKYSSINQHLNQVPTPKDDLESLAYILLVYATNSTLFKIKSDNKSLKFKKLESIKISMIPELTFKQAPLEFIHFLNLVKTSSAHDYPQDYEKYRQLFRKTIQLCGFTEKELTYPLLNFGLQNQEPQQFQASSSRFKKMQNQKMSSESIKEELQEDESSLQNTQKIGEESTIEPLMKGLGVKQFKHISYLNNPPFPNQIVKLKYTKQ